MSQGVIARLLSVQQAQDMAWRIAATLLQLAVWGVHIGVAAAGKETTKGVAAAVSAAAAGELSAARLVCLRVVHDVLVLHVLIHVCKIM